MSIKIGLAMSALVIAALAGGLAFAAQGNDDGGEGPAAGLANPASVFCEQQGGTVEIIADAAGNESGMCRLPDGTQIEEWEYWRRSQPAGAPEEGGLTPLAPEGMPEPETDPVPFVEGEPVYDLESIPVYDEDGNAIPHP
jgi:putative hemolysin